MRAKNKQDALQLSRSLNKFLLAGVGFLGLIVILLSGSITYLALNQPRTLTPPTITQEFTVSGQSTSASYLNMMGEYLLYLKLNVTPENVQRNYQQLLNYMGAEHYHVMQPQFTQEAQEIRQQKISSTFAVKEVNVSSKHFSVKIRGTLQKYVGSRPLAPENVTYLVQFNYPYGVIELDSITRLVPAKA